MVENIREIDVLCLDSSDDPVVVEVFVKVPLGVWQDRDKLVEGLGFPFTPKITKLSDITKRGWVKAEKEAIPNYQGNLPAWKLIRLN